MPAALSAFDEAERRYAVAGRSLGQLPVERAETLLSVLLVAEAQEAAERALVQFRRERNAVDTVQARLVLARAALLAGNPVAARLEADRARRSASRQRRPGWAALAAYLSLRGRWEAGERDASTLRAAHRTAGLLTEAGWAVLALDARLIVARVALELGRVSVARRELAAAGVPEDDSPAEVRARAWHAKALLLITDGKREAAEAALANGMDVLDEFRESLGATELRARASGLGGELATLGLRLAIESGRPEAVLDWAERWRAGALRLRPVLPPDEAELAQDLSELRQVVAALGSEAGGRGDPGALLARQTELEHAIHRRARHASGSRAEVVLATLAELRAGLGARALVEYAGLDSRLYAVVVTGEAMALRELGPLAAVEGELDAVRFGMRRLASRLGSPGSRAAAAMLVDQKAAALDALLFDQVRSDFRDRTLVIVPTSVLHAVPWGLLPTCAGRPVSIAPSAALWLQAATGDGSGTGSGRMAGQRVLVAGPDLEHAATEVDELARLYNRVSRFSGRRARVEPVLAALDGAELAHIAAHGHFRGDNPLFSSLRLVDGPLTVYDIERLGQAPQNVVLSACDSGLPAVHPGDELVGLAAALLSLGTRSLIASVVPVPDAETRTLMVAIHRQLREGLSPSKALATAQQDVSRSGTPADRITAAGFVCFGAG